MAITYTLYNSDVDGEAATLIFSNGQVESLISTNSFYAQVIDILRNTPAADVDEDYIRSLIIPAIAASIQLKRLSERVTFDGSNILFDGDELHGAVANHIIRVIEEGGDSESYAALVAFLEKVSQNPSQTSVNSLYEFLIRHNITIDKDGDFYVYKGVNANGTSIHSGYGIVNGTTMTGHLPNALGAVLEMPRSKVNADTAVGCSTGLHAGSYAYASGFSRGQLLTVKVNPRDVVSVPNDCSYQKIRVSRYKVSGIATVEIKSTTFSYGDDETDHNNITTLENLLESYDEVPVEFTYSRGNDDTAAVQLNVTEVRMNSKNTLIIIGEAEDGEVHSYRWEFITNLSIDEEILDEVFGTEDEDEDYGYYDAADDYYDDDEDDTELDIDDEDEAAQVAVTPTTVTAEETLRAEIANGNDVTITFDYTTVDGEARSLTNFIAREIRDGARGDLLVGERDEDGETRTYRIDRIVNMVIVEVNGVAAAPVDVVAILRTELEAGYEVIVDFTYTSAQSNTRAVKDVTVSEIRNSRHYGQELVVGSREQDDVEKTYRLDRIADLVITEILP